MLEENKLQELLKRMSGPEAAGYQPPQSIEEVHERSFALGKRFALESATTHMLLHLMDQFIHNRDVFATAFAEGIEEVLRPLREMKLQAQRQADRDDQIRRRQAERAAEQETSSASETEAPKRKTANKPAEKPAA